ncbi:MAG: hypothetical protein LC114_18455 [Bryobacterales bacterium]|nr:hypothetical protein [Bryobacterales bacterium]
MRLRGLVFSVLAAVCIVSAHAETDGRLTPISQQNVLELLPAGLRAPEQKVLDTAIAGDNLYFLIGLPYTRPESASVILRLGNDGSHDAILLPPGEVRDLSTDAASNVEALMLPSRRGVEPRMVSCRPSLVSCTTTPFPDTGRTIWARRAKAGHVAELSLDGTLFVDGTKLLPAPTAQRAALEPTRLLSTPGATEVVFLNQATGAVSVVDPSQPHQLRSTAIQGTATEAAKQRNREARATLPASGGSVGMLIYAAALNEDGSLFAALSPYNRFDGALIVETSLDGNTRRTIRCTLPATEDGRERITPSHIAVSGPHLVLVSANGELLRYAI